LFLDYSFLCKKWIADNVEHRGIANSLISKLENVQDNNFEKILSAFINHVEAQSGKKITDARTLIEWADAWVEYSGLAV